MFLTFCGQVRCACSSGNKSSIDLVLPKRLHNTFILLNFIQHLFFIFLCSSCFNGGSCVDGINTFTCLCPPGFTGSYCQHDINECDSKPCLNGGTCQDSYGTYKCTCPPGYTGLNCQVGGWTSSCFVSYCYTENLKLSLLFSQIKLHLTSFELHFEPINHQIKAYWHDYSV